MPKGAVYEAITSSACDIVIVDVATGGGLTEALRVVAVAGAMGMPVVVAASPPYSYSKLMSDYYHIWTYDPRFYSPARSLPPPPTRTTSMLLAEAWCWQRCLRLEDLSTEPSSRPPSRARKGGSF